MYSSTQKKCQKFLSRLCNCMQKKHCRSRSMSSCLEVLFLKPHLNRNPVSWIG